MSDNFAKELLAAGFDSGKARDISGKAVSYYGNKIAEALNPICFEDLLFIYAGLMTVMETLKKLDKETGELGEFIYNMTKGNLHTIAIDASKLERAQKSET